MRPSRPTLRRALLITGLWLVVASLFVGQNVLRTALRGEPVDWLGGVWGEVLYWMVWIALGPAVFALARRFPLERQTAPRHLAVHLLAAVVVALAQAALADALQYALFRWAGDLPAARLARIAASMRASFPLLAATAFWKYWVVAGVYYAFAYYQKFQERHLRAAQLETQLATAQLRALEMQLHPHFLFNALHSAAMLTRLDPEAANRLLVRLSELLRLTLDRGAAPEVPLAEELDFLDRYLGVERMRFRDRLDVRFDADDDALEAPVPRLILQPLVENAVRHAMGARPGACRIAVRGRVARAGTEDGARLVLEVEDDGPGLPAGWRLESHARVGLANVAARLERRFGANGALAFERPRGGGLLVRLTLPVAGGGRGARRSPTQEPARLPYAAAGD